MTASTRQPPGEGIDNFVDRTGLSAAFRSVIENCYAPLAAWIRGECDKVCPLIVGISGAQGTGKSTLAEYLGLSLHTDRGCTVAVLSLDDFYLMRSERHSLARTVHPLLATRGVPGTHDIQMLSTCLEQLRLLQPGETMALPRFDKSHDDRADPATWPVITGPVDVIILEGWCLGVKPQTADALSRAVNALERVTDASGIWRRYVNEQLSGAYADLFDKIDRLIYLRAPGFDAARRWRTDQEHQLAEHLPAHGHSMTDAEVGRFVQHFERLTRAALAAPPEQADVILELDEKHDCAHIDWRQTVRPPES